MSRPKGGTMEEIVKASEEKKRPGKGILCALGFGATSMNFFAVCKKVQSHPNLSPSNKNSTLSVMFAKMLDEDLRI